MRENNGHHKFIEKLRESSGQPTDSLTLKSGASSDTASVEALPGKDKVQLQVLIILLPLYYNVDANGNRRPIESHAFELTFAEIKQFSSGHLLYKGEGWCHSLRFRGDYDEHLRVEIHASFTDDDITFLRGWRQELGLRFRQDSILMGLQPVTWL